MLVIILLVCVSSVKSTYLQPTPCISRNYGNGGTVCVCNCSYCDSIPRPTRTHPSQFLVYTSNLEGLRFQQSRGRFRPLESCESHVDVDSSSKFQTIFGWGGAFTDATGINIHALPKDTQEVLLRQYFSESGIEYSLCRVPMGGTDFSVRAYSYDDGDPDPLLLNFKLAPEDHVFKIPYIKRAMKLTGHKLRLFGSAWTAPKWMKTNYMYTGLGFIRKSMYQPWANYFVKFLDEYRKFGINFWGLTTGNEPLDAWVPGEKLEVVGWAPRELGTWIRNNLGPTIRNSNYSDTKIMILDDQRIYYPWYVVIALENPVARKYVDGFAVHWYTDKYDPPEALTKTQEIFPEKFILATEASNIPGQNESAVQLGSWERGENYSADIIEDVLNWVTGWVDWNMALNPQGGPNYIQNFVDSPIIINGTSNEFYKQPMFYHLGHFSKFVPSGSVRVGTEVRRSRVEVAAFGRPDGGTAVVLLNRNEEGVILNVKDSSRGVAQVKISPRSISTLLYW